MFRHTQLRTAFLIRSAYAAAAIAAIPVLAWNGFVQQLNSSWGDILLRLSGPVQSRTVQDITLVTIDDQTAARFGGLPLNRALLAEGLERIASHQPRAVAVDLLLTDPSRPDSDAALAETLRRHPHIILSAALWGEPSGHTRWAMPLPVFGQTPVGHVHAAPDPDGVVRSILLAKSGEGRRIWALGLEVARMASHSGVPVEHAGWLQLGSIRIPAVENRERQLPIRFAGPEGTYPRVSMSGLLDGSADPAVLRGRIVLVGVTAQGSGDRFVTPVFSGLGMPGIEIHANVVRAILDGDFLNRLTDGGEFALYLSLTVVCVLAVRYLRGRRLAIAVAALVIALAGLLWSASAHFSVLLPAASLAGVFLCAAMAAGAGEYVLLSRTLRKAEEKQRDYAFRLQTIAHEIATPLTAIQGSSELVSDASLPDETRIEMAGLIYRESKRLNSILQAFLDVERMAAGKIKIQKALVDLQPLCQDVVDAARLYGARKKIRVELDVSAPSVQADGDLLTFAVYNLLTNAIKYSPKGSLVRLSVMPAEDSVLFVVADQGYGVSEEDRNRIFERFYRIRRDKLGPEPGSGMGLALVREIAIQHGGRVTVESKPGAGSRFVIALPMDG